MISRLFAQIVRVAQDCGAHDVRVVFYDHGSLIGVCFTEYSLGAHIKHCTAFFDYPDDEERLLDKIRSDIRSKVPPLIPTGEVQ